MTLTLARIAPAPAVRRSLLMLSLLLALTPRFAAVAAVPLPIRVVVVTTFELGGDSGDTPGELQNWVERLPLPQTLPFAAGGRALRYNAGKQVLAVVTGSGAINAAASITALGLDPRFDLRQAYWLVAGIAGVNPATGSVGSVAWARWVIDRDLAHEIDAREIPADWTTGIVPLSRSRPFAEPPPAPGIFSPNAYHLNEPLADWAWALTRDVQLPDSADLAAIRSAYGAWPAAQRPPEVLEGDEVSAMNWWLGAKMNQTAEDWMRYWSGGQGRFVTTAMEDCGVLQALQRLAPLRRVDAGRVMVLRAAANYTVPGGTDSAADLLAAESSTDGATHLSAFLPSLDAAYAVGSIVVNELSAHWSRYRSRMPATGS
jgi:purine nucleoside permease